MFLAIVALQGFDNVLLCRPNPTVPESRERDRVTFPGQNLLDESPSRWRP